jgi:hypothetical protein
MRILEVFKPLVACFIRYSLSLGGQSGKNRGRYVQGRQGVRVWGG